MTTLTPPRTDLDAQIGATVRKYWGYDGLRPHQAAAIRHGLAHEDSLVVLPTGGGKSLCYQVPPVIANRTDIVVSPLIALMKDQVDGLQASGYPAAALHSGLSDSERQTVTAGIVQGRYRLVFVAPERLLTAGVLRLVEQMQIRAFAIDEAHCISQWGHDFRPEYRQLAQLRERFPEASFHAYTATATPRVQDDIVRQLGLRQPRILIGEFDRPNLVYRVIPRTDGFAQVLAVLKNHTGEAAIVYCLSRKDTEQMADALRDAGVKAAAYHAGLDKGMRTRTQDEFSREEIDVVVATIAFGMGIDRSNVRCVIHATLPKSIEHYQQETGRAGRDGLEAECVLFYSRGDVNRWHYILSRDGETAPDVQQAQMALVADMERFASGAACRHAALSRYFGQDYKKGKCEACDVCLDETDIVADSTAVARKVFGAVGDLNERFGVGHVVDVLVGAKNERIQQFGHTRLESYGAMKATPRKIVQDLVFQLVNQGLLLRTEGDRPLLKLTAEAREALAGNREVVLHEPAAPKYEAGSGRDSPEDKRLFESLRGVRRLIATERGVPPFVILHDSVLLQIARTRPRTLTDLVRIAGIGETKLADFGERILSAVADFDAGRPVATAVRIHTDNPVLANAYTLFEQGVSIDDAAAKLGKSRGTTAMYLAQYVAERRVSDVGAWVAPAVYQRVAAAAVAAPDGMRLKPIFEALNGEVSYDEIRVVLAHREANA